MNLLLNDFKEKHISEGNLLFREGDKANSLYLLKSGLICNFLITKDKRVVPISSLKNEGVIGEEGVFSDSLIHKHNSISLTDVTVYVIPVKTIDKIMQESPSWIKNVLLNLSEKVEKTQEMLAEHKIIDSRNFQDEHFSAEYEKIILKAL